VVTTHEVLDSGTVVVRGDRIQAVLREEAQADEVVNLEDRYLVPGFVDLQVNGAFGIDVATSPERLDDLSRKLLLTGTTAYLPTIVTQPLERYARLLPAISWDEVGGAKPMGLHLEGPFINPHKRGAHPEENVAVPNAGALAAMLEMAPVKLVTLAPEVHGASDLVEVAASRGAVVSLGHSDASFEEARAALDGGARSVTHLFNAMSPLHHRHPGLPGAALSHPSARCGIVMDGFSVHPEVARLAYERLGPDRLYLVTDAMAAAGTDSGEYSLAGLRVTVSEGLPRLEDGTIAGSVLLMHEALRNALEFTGCALHEAVRMAATTPADLVGARKGRLAEGYDDDILALSPELDVEMVWAGGVLHRHRNEWEGD
jgi:N-acetylglucosamine-6-phosphate deacetylase